MRAVAYARSFCVRVSAHVLGARARMCIRGSVRTCSHSFSEYSVTYVRACGYVTRACVCVSGREGGGSRANQAMDYWYVSNSRGPSRVIKTTAIVDQLTR